MLQGISRQTPAPAVTTAHANPKAERQEAAKNETVDQFTKTQEPEESGAYSASSLERLRADHEQRINSFNSMLQQMLGKQLDKINKASFQGLDITPADQQAAQASIAPGGEWSPEAVSGRILDMAKALSGGDASKFGMLKDAVLKGFGAAEKQWGSALPDITKDTYDRVMKGFDDWEKELRGAAGEVADAAGDVAG